MDNFTHSMAGALLGQMGLKRLSGRAMGTLVIAANIPDIDAVATLFGTESLAVRRGITHGPIAMLLLPMLLTGLVLLWNRWRPSDQPVRPKQLLLLAYVGTLSHPALDFLNSYGIRLLEPFSSKWVYGDTLFIIDVWIWAALVIGFLWSRRREQREGEWRRPAIAAGAAILGYIAANGLITRKAEVAYRRTADFPAHVEVVASPVPVLFWRRSILWRSEMEGVYGPAADDGPISYSFFGETADSASIDETRLDHPALAASRGRADVEAFLFWSRMPIVLEEGGRAYLADQRFNSSLTRRPFVVPLDSPQPR